MELSAQPESAVSIELACGDCEACCVGLAVPVTHRDLLRLVAHTGLPPHELVSWRLASELDLEGEPETLVQFACGFRFLVLARQGAACRWLKPGQGCSIYSARPICCRVYPLEHDGELCFQIDGALCNRQWEVERGRIIDAVASRQRELSKYVDLVQRFNRRQRLRRKLGRSWADERAFLAQLLASTPRVSSPATRRLQVIP